MKCEVHPNCEEAVVAKIGLPSAHAKWACKRGFFEFTGEGQQPPPEADAEAMEVE